MRGTLNRIQVCAVAGILASAVAACSGDGGGDDGEPVDPELQVGVLVDGTFSPFSDGETCYVVDARAGQGGFWVMPAMRMRGMTDHGIVTCALEDDELGVLGEQDAPRLFEEVSGEDGTFQIDIYLLPLTVDEATFDALPGHTGELRCLMTDDDGLEADFAVSVAIDTRVL